MYLNLLLISCVYALITILVLNTKKQETQMKIFLFSICIFFTYYIILLCIKKKYKKKPINRINNRNNNKNNKINQNNKNNKINQNNEINQNDLNNEINQNDLNNENNQNDSDVINNNYVNDDLKNTFDVQDNHKNNIKNNYELLNNEILEKEKYDTLITKEKTNNNNELISDTLCLIKSSDNNNLINIKNLNPRDCTNDNSCLISPDKVNLFPRFNVIETKKNNCIEEGEKYRKSNIDNNNPKKFCSDCGPPFDKDCLYNNISDHDLSDRFNIEQTDSNNNSCNHCKQFHSFNL